MIVDGTYLVSGKYAVHTEFNEDLSHLEYLSAVEDLENIGAVVIPHDNGSITNGNLQVLEVYQRIDDALDYSQWDLENSEKESEEWIEASESVENFKNELEEFLTLEGDRYTLIIDRSVYKKYCGSDPDLEVAKDLLDWYIAFANNECLHIAIIPLSGDDLGDWEDRITDLDLCYLHSIGGDLIPVPEIGLLDHEVIKILNENGYHVKDNAKFIEVSN